MRAEPFLETLRKSLLSPRPQAPADEAEPTPEGEFSDPADIAAMRRASVLAPFFVDGGEPGVVLVQRSDRLGKHAGQIAFPGGGRDACEDDLACALRESREEIGLPPEEVEILGRLATRPTRTGYLVSPFVGRLRRWPIPLRADPGEVASILTVPVGRLIEPGVLREATLAPGRTLNFFDVGEHVIWGATARMLREILELGLGRRLQPRGEVPWEKVRW